MKQQKTENQFRETTITSSKETEIEENDREKTKQIGKNNERIC